MENLNLNEDEKRSLEEVARTENISVEDAIHRAIGIQDYFKDAVKKGKVLVEQNDGKILEVDFS